MMTIAAPSVRRFAFALSSLLASGAVLAHPGHDTAPSMSFLQGLEHLLTQPDHFGMLVGAVVIGVAAVRAARRRGTWAGRR